MNHLQNSTNKETERIHGKNHGEDKEPRLQEDCRTWNHHAYKQSNLSLPCLQFDVFLSQLKGTVKSRRSSFKAKNTSFGGPSRVWKVLKPSTRESYQIILNPRSIPHDPTIHHNIIQGTVEALAPSSPAADLSQWPLKLQQRSTKMAK